MKAFIFILFIFFSAKSFAITGDGSDGPCNWSNITPPNPSTQSQWNCTTLTIDDTIDFSTTESIDIRVQGEVTINGTLSLNANGRIAGPGGFDGGEGSLTGGSDGESPSGIDSGGRAGESSEDGFGGGLADCHASGGSGGAHSSDPLLATENIPFQGDCDPEEPSGAEAPSQSYGGSFTTSSLIYGGSGGGAGGAGENSGDKEPGGNGGGGGGSLRLIAGGDIDFSASGAIEANGANGALGVSRGGGGGGGAGGSIYIVTLTNINLEASSTLSAVGGDGGEGDTGNGGIQESAGGDGGNGYIRLENSTGEITGGNITPSPSIGLNPIERAKLSTSIFQSDIGVGCAFREIGSFPYLSFLLIFLLPFLVIKLNRSSIFGRRSGLIRV